MLWLLLQKYGIIPAQNVDAWLLMFAAYRWMMESVKDQDFGSQSQ